MSEFHRITMREYNVDNVSNNVNVDNNINNNVYDDNVASKIQDALDKPRAIGEILASKLNAPQNTKFYIKLAYLYPTETLFECVSLALDASKEGRITTDLPRYFWGVLRRKKSKTTQ